MDMHLATLEMTTGNRLASKLRDALTRAIAEDHKLDPEVLALEGMSGRKYRYLINNLIGSIDDARYLEVGVWLGSTFFSAIYRNKVRALAIDDWSFDGDAATKFLAHASRFKGPGTSLSFLEADFRSVNFSAIGKFNVYLFDGPHEA